MKRIFLILFCVAWTFVDHAQTVINSSANTPLPPSALWNGIINQKPGTNETVTVNPPIFSWFYSPTNPAWSAYDPQVYQYQFQASYQSNFSSLIFDIRTLSDCYNFLAPFTSSPVYWRVGYLDTNSPAATNVWITNVFKLPNNSTNGVKQWDRSYLANTNNWTPPHPYLWLNAGNKSAMHAWFVANKPTQWTAITNFAQTALNQPWWTTNTWGTNVLDDEDTRGIYIQAVAFTWMMTGDGHWTNGLIQTYSNLVQYHQSAQRWTFDYSQGTGEGMLRAIIFGYDWLYPMLPSGVQSNSVAALRKIVRGNLYNLFWFTPTNHATSITYHGSDPTGEFVGPYQMAYGQAPNFWASHPKLYTQYTWIACLPILADDPDARLLFDLYINYEIGRMTPYGMAAVNRGRAYGWRDTFSHGTISMLSMLQASFPQMAFTNNPVLPNLMDWWLRMTPPGYIVPAETWGDYTTYNTRDWWRRPEQGYQAATFTGNGAIEDAMNKSIALYGIYDQADQSWDAYINGFYFAEPAPTTNTTLAAVFPNEGYVSASEYPPNLTECFSNGVIVNFASPPMGSELDHTRLNANDVEILAYGCPITASQGGSGYAARPTYMCNTVLINGTNQIETAWGPRVPVYGQIIAYTNGSDFTYFCGEAAPCFPHDPFPLDPFGGTDNPVGFQLLGTDVNYAMPYVSRARRHVLFMHRKYVVLYDDMATTNNSSFQWIWHSFETNALGIGGSFTYNARPLSPDWTYPWSLVKVCVFQVVNSNLLAVTNMLGDDVYKNPYMNVDLSAWKTYEGAIPMTNAVWITNLTPTNQFHFMTVVFPVKPGDADPTMTRLDDYTVRVQSGTNDDTITFGGNTNANYTISAASSGGGGQGNGGGSGSGNAMYVGKVSIR